MINESYLIKLLDERDSIIDHATKNYETLNILSNASESVKFGTRCDDIGCFYPGIIKYKRDKKSKKGKLLKEKPNDSNYVLYESRRDDVPLRLRKFNKYGCESRMYFYRSDGFDYCVPFLRDTSSVFGKVYKYSFEHERISEYAEIDKTVIVLEKYDYRHLSDGYYECTWYYYYNSKFSSMSYQDFDMVTGSLDEMLKEKIKKPPDLTPVIRKNVYYYKIFLNSEKIGKIEEYSVDDGEINYIRNI